jgi:hypothetical protein
MGEKRVGHSEESVNGVQCGTVQPFHGELWAPEVEERFGYVAELLCD